MILTVQIYSMFVYVAVCYQMEGGARGTYGKATVQLGGGGGDDWCMAYAQQLANSAFKGAA